MVLEGRKNESHQKNFFSNGILLAKSWKILKVKKWPQTALRVSTEIQFDDRQKQEHGVTKK